MKNRGIVWRFKGRYRFLSNFYLSPIRVDGYLYKTVEHYFQSMKVTDPRTAKMIREAETPRKARKLGRRVPIRSDWKEVRDNVMRRGVYEKFIQHPELEEKLLETGDMILVEGNFWGDYYWGCVFDEGTKRGENRLGIILMEVRKYLQDTHPEKRSFDDFIAKVANTIEFDCEKLMESPRE